MGKTRWLALLLTGAAEAALAQSTGTRPAQVGASARPSNGAPVRQIGIRAAVEASYDSNVYGAGGNVISANRSKDDISITPSLLLDIVLPFGRNSAFLQGQIGYDFYTKNSQLNRERISLDGGASLAVAGSCVVSPNASYARLRSNAGDVFFRDVNGLVQANKNVEERTSFGAQVQCGSAIGLTPTIGYRHSTTRNSTVYFEQNDSNQDVIDGSLGYSRPSLGRLSLFGSYSRGEYLGRDINGQPRRLLLTSTPNPLFDPTALDGIKSYSAGLRFERNIGSKLFGAASLGYSWVDPVAPTARKFRGSSYSLDLGFRPTDRLSIDLAASRAADLSNTVFATYSVTDIYSLNGTYRLNPRLSVNFGSSYQKRDYRTTLNFQGFGPFSFIDKDEFTRGYVGVVYDLNRRLRLNGLFSQQGRKADDRQFNYTNTTLTVGASYRLGR